MSDLNSFVCPYVCQTKPWLFLTLASAEPTSAPLDLFIEDKNDTSVSIIWSQPEVVGHTGLDGYVIEIAKDGSKSLLCLLTRCTQCWHVHDRGQIINTPWRKSVSWPFKSLWKLSFQQLIPGFFFFFISIIISLVSIINSIGFKCLLKTLRNLLNCCFNVGQPYRLQLFLKCHSQSYIMCFLTSPYKERGI